MTWDDFKEWLAAASEDKSLWRGLILLWSFSILSYLVRNEEAPALINPLWVVSHGIHEIGHWVTTMFGSWVSVASGTIFEHLFPFVFIVGMLKNRDLHGAFVIMTWQGATFLHSAHYAGSAEYSGALLETPFGQELYHDWVWMLSRLNAIHRARDVEDVFFFLAIAFCILSILGQLASLFFIWKHARTT